MSGGANYGQTGGNMYGSQYGLGPNAGMAGGNMYGAMGKQGGGIGQPLGPNAGQVGGNMGAPQPSPMDAAFSPTSTGARDGFGGGQDALLTGQYPGSAPPLDASGTASGGLGNPWAAAPTAPPSDAWMGATAGGPDRYGAQAPLQSALLTGDYGQAGGNMGGPWGGQAGGNMYGAMGKQGGGVNSLNGMATTNPVGTQPSGRYGDYMNRRNAWIDQLRGYVAQPTPWGKLPPRSGGGPMPDPSAPAPGGPPTSAPPGGPYQPKAGAAGGIDHMANLRALMGEDPRLANEYRLRNGDTLGWWQGNQGNVAQGLFGGDNQKMQEWIRNTSPVSSNASPLTQAEMMRLNQMAGIRGPSWMR